MTLVSEHAAALGPPSDRAVRLTDADATDPATSGAKAANLAIARAVGLPVVDGFVVPVAAVDANPIPGEATLAAWAELSDDGRRAVVVRSSSPNEDLAGSSLAGVFDSVVDVRGWADFVEAYLRVVRSARGAPMAVLVQALVVPELGGVLFGVDPVSGRDDRTVIVAVDGGPHDLVAGTVQGHHVVVDRHARVRDRSGDDHPRLTGRDRRRLVALHRKAATLFGGPQDIEWAIESGRVRLLQSRPITTVGPVAAGPLLGPGPVAETFPEPLARLEIDLWVPPLQDAMSEVLSLTGAAGNRALSRSPVALVVDRQVVVDLRLVGDVSSRRNRLVRLLDPRPALRRLGASWRVGRLTGAIRPLARALLADVDHQLATMPDPATLDDRALVDVLDNASAYLRALHGYEMLVGALVDEAGGTAAAEALRTLEQGRSRGWTDDDLVARTPVVLALTVPSIGPRPPLPHRSDRPTAAIATSALSLREELRLRVRWVHELTRRVALDIGTRLADRDVLETAEHVARLDRAAIRAVFDGRPITVPAEDPPVTPVPSRFRVADDGSVVAERGDGTNGGVGAGGGRGRGPVTHTDPAPGDVLVVRTLDPSLAGDLPGLAGIVSETGSPLSHLAILAREHGVPAVVGLVGALDRFPEGTDVVVDGTVGSVESSAPTVTS